MHGGWSTTSKRKSLLAYAGPVPSQEQPRMATRPRSVKNMILLIIIIVLLEYRQCYHTSPSIVGAACRDSWSEAFSDIFLFIVNKYLRQSSFQTILELLQLKSFKLKLWGFLLIQSSMHHGMQASAQRIRRNAPNQGTSRSAMNG